MGLDIYACRQVKLAPVQGFDADGDPLDENGIRLYVNPDFPGRCDEWPNGTVMLDDRERQYFWGRGYGTYNLWREELAKLAGWPLTEYEERVFGDHYEKKSAHAAGAWAAESGPFWELINFSDCEGAFGTATCKKLAQDFAEFQPKADAHPIGWFRDSYAKIRAAFECGADGGLVEFR